MHKDHGRTVCLLCDNHGEQNEHTFLFRYVCGKKPQTQTLNYAWCIYARKKARKERVFFGVTGPVSYLAGGAGGCNPLNSSKITCLWVWASDKFSVQKWHPTTGEVLCCRGTQTCRNWVCDGWIRPTFQTPTGAARPLAAAQVSLPTLGLKLPPIPPAHAGQLERSPSSKQRKTAENTS